MTTTPTATATPEQTMFNYHVSECGYQYQTVKAPSAETALEMAKSEFDPLAYPQDADEPKTTWVDVEVRLADADGCKNDCQPDTCGNCSPQYERATITIEPIAPDCPGGDHDWESPVEIVGGIEDNPGVWGQGAGVIITTVCRHCGIYQIINTWDQRTNTGEQGLESTLYKPADEKSRGVGREKCRGPVDHPGAACTATGR